MNRGEHDLLPFEEVEGEVETIDDAEYESGPSLAEDLSLLAEQATAYARAEFAFQKSRAAYAAAEGRTIALLYVVGAVLAFFAAMALVVGSVIALGPVLGAWGAMATVTFFLLLIVFLCVSGARSRTKRMLALVSDNNISDNEANP